MSDETNIPAPSKRETLERLLEQDHILVYANTSAKGLVVPPHLYSAPSVTLKLSKLFRGGLWFEEEKVTSDLLFGPNYFTCEIPYASIWGVASADGDSEVWADALPPQIDPNLARQAITPEHKIKRVGESKPQTTGVSPAKKTSRPSHLRRIK